MLSGNNLFHASQGNFEIINFYTIWVADHRQIEIFALYTYLQILVFGWI